MIRYKISGCLPAPWEDFRTRHPGAPNVTIITEANRQEDDAHAEAEAGWVTCFLPGDLLTAEKARRELARINGVGAGAIAIEQGNSSQSI